MLKKILLITAIFFLGATAGYIYILKAKPFNQSSIQEKNVYLTFLDEVYFKIKENYWEKIEDEQLVSLFVLGANKITDEPKILQSNDKPSLDKMLAEIINQTNPEKKKKEFAAQLADVVLANLKPFGRSRLYTQKDETALKQNVENVNPDVNQYEVLGVEKEADQKEIETAYQEKEKTPEVEQAYKVLADEANRKVYDISGAEPTMDYKLIRPEIFYLHLKKFSPTTFDELKRVTEKVDDQKSLDTLIFDLRDNIGGAIDGLPYFIGPFIGQDQYAYQFFHQGEKTDFKTKIGWLPSLVRYKKVVILINENTQSSAEVMAAVLKKYNVGVLVGTTSKGWGTVEKVFQMENQIDPAEKNSIFMVHELTLRDDGQPIEGRGVDPVIDINDPEWEKQLYSYFHYQDLVEAVKEIW